jgi:hypothetical protein
MFHNLTGGVMTAEQAVRRLLEMARDYGAPVKLRLPVGSCGTAGCSGYHPVEALIAHPNGLLEHCGSPYGVHSIVQPFPSPQRVGLGEAERVAARMLRRARRALRHPYLSWAEVLETAVEVLEARG